MIDADKLKELRDTHAISEEEYLEQKKRLAAAVLREGRRAERKNGIVYILLAFFLGAIGIHNFYAGYWGRALSQLCLSVISPWFLFVPLLAVSLWVLVEILFVNRSADGKLFEGSRRIVWWLRIATVAVLALGFSYNGLVVDEAGVEEVFVY